MPKPHSVASDLRKNYVNHSNFKSPFKKLSKNSKTQHIPPAVLLEQQKKKNSAEAKLVQEILGSRNLVEMGPPPSGQNSNDEFLQVYPFVEEPVSFNFGDDYGNYMFLDLKKEFAYEIGGKRRGLFDDVFEATDHLSDDVFIFSSEAGMINSFFMENYLV